MKHLIIGSQVKNFKTEPGKKIKKIHDGEGLYLWIYSDGKKWWRFRYRLNGKNKPEMSLGAWPKITLAEARKKADEAREKLKQGIDPVANRKAVKAARIERETNTFEILAREWWSTKTTDKSDSHRQRILISLEKDIFPFLGAWAVAEIEPPEILTAIDKVVARGAVETAHRILGRCGMVFRYGVATGRCKSDPTRDLRGALPPVTTKNMAAITNISGVASLLRAIDAYQGSFVVRAALQFSPLVFVRPGELRHAEWKDIDFDEAEWRFTVSKTRKELIVPLSKQAISILKELQPYTGSGKYVFPGRGVDRPMSNNAILAALRRMDFSTDEMTGHGFRAMARTLLAEHKELKFPVEIIELQLAHNVKDPLGTAYNRTSFLDDRHEMMQRWADFLDKLKGGDNAKKNDRS